MTPKRQRTRALLIDCALAVAEERGFIGASLDEIAARAGMSKGAIYSNFGSKADLMYAAVEGRGLTLQPDYVTGGTLADQLAAVAEALIRALPRAGGLQRLQSEFQAYLSTEPQLRHRVGEVYRAAFARLEAAIAEAYGAELAVAPRTVVLASQALSAGFFHQHALTPEAVDAAAIREAFAALAAGAITA